MYLDILSSGNISSLANSAKATYAECLESIITLREAEFAAERELLSVEFKNYHLGLEAEDATFWSKVQTNVRKLLEILKAVASKITAYIQTVPGRIHNFVLGVANWFAKIGLEAKAKKLMEQQNRKTQDPNKAKDFTTTEFGPRNFDEILLKKNTSEEAQAAADNTEPGIGVKFYVAIDKFIGRLLSVFYPDFKKNVEEKLRVVHEQSRVNAANTTDASGTETIKTAEAIGNDKITTLKEFAESDKEIKEGLALIEDAARAISEGHKYDAVPSPDIILGMVKTITNGNIEKQARSLINAIDRLKRQLDAIGRTNSAAFSTAYAQKDSTKISEIQTILAECRYQYTLFIKIIVRIDTAAQRCTSNTIKWAKAAMDCYVINPEARDAPKVKEAGAETPPDNTAENNGADANATADANGTTATSDNVQDFSHIFDF